MVPMASSCVAVNSEKGYKVEEEAYAYIYSCSTLKIDIENPTVLQKMKDILSNEDFEAMTRYRRKEDRTMGLVSRVLQRLLIASYSGENPKLVRIKREYGTSGANSRKPFWVQDDNDPSPFLNFNVSHDSGLVVIATSRNVVGVDCMKIALRGLRSLTEYFQLMNDVFSPKEWQYIKGGSTLPQSSCEMVQIRRFMELWTMKEAFAKAIGAGLAIEPSRLECCVTSGNGEVLENRYICLDGICVEDFKFHIRDYEGEYIITLCIALIEDSVKVYQDCISKNLKPENIKLKAPNYMSSMKLKVTQQNINLLKCIEAFS